MILVRRWGSVGAVRGRGSRSTRLMAYVLVVSTIPGCAIQTGVSTVHHTPDATSDRGSASSAAWDIEGRLVDVRGDGAYASGHLAMADPDAPSRFTVRRFDVGAGYRFVDCCVSLELGGEVGAGEPTQRSYDAISLYMGSASSLMVRVLGDQDVEPGFAAIGVLVDVGVTARAGGWLPARGTQDPILFEGSLQGGVRATIISDLFDATGEDLDR